jgi:cystathionine beta-lyase/cystathionine gamma-synthase
MEGWLGVRSVRTLEVRVERQSGNAEKIVAWLDGLLRGEGKDEHVKLVQSMVSGIKHASLQKEDVKGWLGEQMPNGYGPVFALWMKSESLARRLPSHLALMLHATSLGGVESLVEWRRMSDDDVDPTLLRVSVGIEGWEDLRDDLLRAFQALADEDRPSDA